MVAHRGFSRNDPYLFTLFLSISSFYYQYYFNDTSVYMSVFKAFIFMIIKLV
jgi:hypothetical protein